MSEHDCKVDIGSDEYWDTLLGKKLSFSPSGVCEDQYYFAGLDPDENKDKLGHWCAMLVARHTFSMSWNEGSKVNFSLADAGPTWPTMKQLQQLSIRPFLGFQPRVYWSCEEESIEKAWGYHFADGRILSGSKDQYCLVRPIKLVTRRQLFTEKGWFWRESWDEEEDEEELGEQS